MARKLYVFAIGGTGSRVLKALTMLLASGCRLKNEFETVIPIIIDPDTSNGDLNRTKDILRLYQEIRNQVQHPDNFFHQRISTIHDLADNSDTINPDYFHFKLNGVSQSNFGEYIGYDSLSQNYKEGADDKSFVKLLYSDKNLKSDLNVGFKGNPNMGSIVLNQFTDSEDFKKFGQTFNDGDAIFIINSIFGGTGAAGFPLLLKNLRGNQNIPRHAKIKSSPIGGITYLPYFSLDKQDEIKSESFEEKAKAAIDYYNRTIIGQKQIDSIYFVGNRGNTNYLKYSVGGEEQENKAHFLELAGALAIMDFCENIERVNTTLVKEFGIEKDTNTITFDDLNIENARTIEGPLSRYKLFAEYLEKGLEKALNVSRWTKSDIKLVTQRKNSDLNHNYFHSSEFKNQILAFNKHFLRWLDEMEDNQPAFSPFQAIEWNNALALVKDRRPKGTKSFKALDIENCIHIDDEDIKPSLNNKRHTTLIKLFDKTTKILLTKKAVIKN